MLTANSDHCHPEGGACCTSQVTKQVKDSNMRDLGVRGHYQSKETQEMISCSQSHAATQPQTVDKRWRVGNQVGGACSTMSSEQKHISACDEVFMDSSPRLCTSTCVSLTHLCRSRHHLLLWFCSSSSAEVKLKHSARNIFDFGTKSE